MHNIFSELLGLVIRVGVDTVFGENAHGEEVHAGVDEGGDVVAGVFSVVQDLSTVLVYSYVCKILLGACGVYSRPYDSDQRIVLQRIPWLLQLEHLSFPFLVEVDDARQGEAAAYVVATHEQVVRRVDQQLVPILKEHTYFVLGRLVLDVLHCFEGKLTQDIIYELAEFLGIVLTNEEDMLNLLNFSQASNVMIDYGMTSNYTIVKV